MNEKERYSKLNKIIFENGISHELTDDEIKILKIAIKGFNWCDVICSEEREKQLKIAYENLTSLFIDHLD